MWKHPNARVAYVAQHAFHHIESHLEKTPNEYIRWRYEHGSDKEGLEKVRPTLTLTLTLTLTMSGERTRTPAPWASSLTRTLYPIPALNPALNPAQPYPWPGDEQADRGGGARPLQAGAHRPNPNPHPNPNPNPNPNPHPNANQVLIDVADDKGVTKTMKAVFKRFTEGRRKVPKSKDQEYEIEWLSVTLPLPLTPTPNPNQAPDPQPPSLHPTLPPKPHPTISSTAQPSPLTQPSTYPQTCPLPPTRASPRG